MLGTIGYCVCGMLFATGVTIAINPFLPPDPKPEPRQMAQRTMPKQPERVWLDQIEFRPLAVAVAYRAERFRQSAL